SALAFRHAVADLHLVARRGAADAIRDRRAAVRVSPALFRMIGGSATRDGLLPGHPRPSELARRWRGIRARVAVGHRGMALRLAAGLAQLPAGAAAAAGKKVLWGPAARGTEDGLASTLRCASRRSRLRTCRGGFRGHRARAASRSTPPTAGPSCLTTWQHPARCCRCSRSAPCGRWRAGSPNAGSPGRRRGARRPDVGGPDRCARAAAAIPPADQAEPGGEGAAPRREAAALPHQTAAPLDRRLTAAAVLRQRGGASARDSTRLPAPGATGRAFPRAGKKRRAGRRESHEITEIRAREAIQGAARLASLLTVFQLRDVAVTPRRFSMRLLVNLVSAAPFGHHKNASLPRTQIWSGPNDCCWISRASAGSGSADRKTTKNRDGFCGAPGSGQRSIAAAISAPVRMTTRTPVPRSAAMAASIAEPTASAGCPGLLD